MIPNIGLAGRVVALLVVGSSPCSAAVTASLAPHAVAVAPRPPTVSVVSHGLKLSLSLPTPSYPRDALIRVAITLQNVSRHSIAIGTTWGPICLRPGPGVEVLDDAAQIVYPPAIEWLLGSCGKKIPPMPLRPGGTLHPKTYAILRADALRAIATLGSGDTFATPILHLHLTSGAAPQLRVLTDPTRVVVQPVANWGNRFYYQYSISCPVTTDEATLTGTPWWIRGAIGADGAFRRSAECSSPVQWRFVGGWLGHPVATLTLPLLRPSLSCGSSTTSSGGRSGGDPVIASRSVPRARSGNSYFRQPLSGRTC